MGLEKKRLNFKEGILISLLVLIIGFATLEIISPLLFKSFKRPVFSYSSKYIWTFVPNLRLNNFSTNSVGFRDTEHELVNTDNDTRIIFLGDSYVAGNDFPEDIIFTGHLEKKLNSRNNTERYEVFNFGVNGYATDQELLILKDAINYNPDMVFLVVVPNDIRESYAKNIFFIKNNTLILNKSNKAFNLNSIDRILWYMTDRSLFFSILESRLSDKYGKMSYIFSNVIEFMSFKNTYEYNADSILFLKEETQEMKDAIYYFSGLIEEIKRICNENNARLILVNLPIKMQFDGSMSDEKIFDQAKMRAILQEISQKHNISFIDLYDIINKTTNPLDYYISEEYHLNERGHTLVGEELYKAI